MPRTSEKPVPLRNIRALVTTKWDRGYKQKVIRQVESFYVDSSLDNDADQWQIEIGDPTGEYLAMLERNNEVRIQLMSAEPRGGGHLLTGIADELTFTQDGTHTITGRDYASLALDSTCPPTRFKHVKAKYVIANQARKLGFPAVSLNEGVGMVKKAIKTDGSESYWEFWYRLYRNEKMYLWCSPQGTLIGNKLNYNDPVMYYFGVPLDSDSRAVQSIHIPVEGIEIRKSTQGRVAECWVYVHNGKLTYMVKTGVQDPTISQWVKKPFKMIQDTQSHTIQGGRKKAWEEIYEGKVGSYEIRLNIVQTRALIRPNRMCRLHIPQIGVHGIFFIVGTKVQAGPNGFVQEIRLREKLIALSRRVPQEPKMPRVKQAPKMPAGSLMTGGESAGWLTGGGDAIVANLIPNDDHSIWADIFWKAANEFHDPWDFDIFLAVLLGICHQETTFRNIRQNGMNVGRDGIEWHLAPQEKNLFDKSDTNPIDLWRLDFVNEKGSLGLDMEAGVGPMQLTDPGLKKQADELFASKGGKSNPVHDQWSGGRWDITSNIFTAAKYFKGCLGMTGMDPSTGDQLAAMWLACSAYNAGHIIPNFPYSNSVKKWVLNDPGYLTKVKDAMTTARTENKQTGGDRISEGSTGSKIMPGGWPNEEQCIAAFRGKWAGPGNLFAKDGTLSTVEKALINIGDLTPAEFRQYKTVCAALYCYYNQDKMVYNNNRPVNDKFQPPPYVPDALDCSAFTTYCFAVSGCPDPNGANYRGGMNTATLWQQGRLIGGETVKANQLRPGDMCFYAYGTPLHAGNSEHVTIYIGNGKCISQGSDEGPLLLPYNESSKPFVGARRYQF